MLKVQELKQAEQRIARKGRALGIRARRLGGGKAGGGVRPENIPEEKKGEGKVFRKATPGGWREDLTPKQVEIVERITAPLREEFYPA